MKSSYSESGRKMSWVAAVGVATLSLLGSATSAAAQNVTADSISANGTPPTWGSGSCRGTIQVLSDGSIANPGYCPLGPIDENFTITFTFSPGNESFMTGLEIWANEGRSMRDNELRRLDVEVDYFDPATNSVTTLVLDDQSIGDTETFDDPRPVSFTGPGVDGLYRVSEVRISNLVGRSANAYASLRELQGVFATLPVAPVIGIASSETGSVADGGGDAHGTETAGVAKTVTYTITNTGTDDLDLTGTPAISNVSNISGSVSVTPPAISSLPPGASTTFQVTYTPEADGPYGFDIDVTHNDPDDTNYDIAVTGDANEVPGVTLVAEPSPPAGPFQITATFTEPVTGMDASDFDITNGTPSGFANPSPGVYTIFITPIDPTLPIGVIVPAAAAVDGDNEPNTQSNAIGIAIANAPDDTELAVIEEIIIEETLRDLRNSIALNQRVMRQARDRHAGFLRCHNRTDDLYEETVADAEEIEGCNAVRGLTVEPTFVGKFTATDSITTGTGAFFMQSSNEDGSRRRLAFGELSFNRYDDGDVSASLTGRVAWERLFGQDVLGGVFIGASAVRSDIDDVFSGRRTGYGLNAGAYFVDQLDTNLFWDGYISVGAGRNNLDLGNEALDVDGDYNTVSAEVGLAVTGVRTYERFELHPELSVAYGVTSVGDADLTSSSISGTSQETLSVENVALGTIRFRPEIVIPGEVDRFGTVRRSLSIAPSILCETVRTDVSDSECGGGLELEWSSRSQNGLSAFSARASREVIGGETRDQISISLERQF